jgi:uncharacterized integral membrane protein
MGLAQNRRRRMMYLSLIITFLLLLAIIIPSIQNTGPLEMKFITWKLQMSLTALILYSSLFGAAVVAVLVLPKLVTKYLKGRHLNKEIYELKRRIVELEREAPEGPGAK